MKIGLVDTGAGDAGQDCPFAELATALAALGHDVSSFVTGPVEQIGDLIRELNQQLFTGAYDVIHSHGGLAGLATQLAAPGSGIPLVHTLDLGLGHHGPGDRPEPGERALNADRLIVGSTFEQRALLRAGIPRTRMTVVPPGVAAPDAEDIRRPPNTGRRHFPEVVVFGSPARVAEVVHCLRALANVRLLVCGTPLRPIAEADGELTRLADALGVADRVRLVQGDTRRARVPLIRDASVVVCVGSPARAGTEHLEAMALGIPVVAANEVAAEAVVDGVTGLHAVNARPRALMMVLAKLLDRPVLRTQMSVAGRDRAITRYSWARIATETQYVYEELLRRRAPAPEAQVALEAQAAPLTFAPATPPSSE